MAYQSQFEYAEKLSRIKLDNYDLRIQRTLTTTNRYTNYCQIQETTGLSTDQTDPSLSLDLSYQLLDGFNVQTSPQIVTAGTPGTPTDIGGLRLVCNESGIYKIDVYIRATSQAVLCNQALIRGVNGLGFQNVPPTLGNPADSLLYLHPRNSTISVPFVDTQIRMNSIARLNFNDFVQVSFASPNGVGGQFVCTIQTMTIHLTKLNS